MNEFAYLGGHYLVDGIDDSVRLLPDSQRRQSGLL